MIKKLSGMLAALTVAFPVFGSDLLQLYRDAQDNDATFSAARATAEAGQEKLPQARAGLLPSLTLSGSVAWNEGNTTYTGISSTDLRYNSNSYSLTLSQPLFRWQNWVGYQEGKLLVAQSEAQFALARQDLILRLAQAYFDVLYGEENLRSVQAQKEAISQQLEQAKKYFEVGTATITDTHEAQARYDLAIAQEIAAESDLEVKKRALQLITGRETPDLSSLREQFTLNPPDPASMDAWAGAAAKDAINVQYQSLAAELASREVERANAGHYPTVDLVANAGRSNSATVSGNQQIGYDNTFRNVGVQVTIPLYQGGAVSSKAREAAANRTAALAGLEAARRSAVLGARQYYLGVVNGLAQVRALQAALASSQLALESNKLGYEVGVRINIDVLNAEQQVYSTQRDLAKARIDTLLAQLRLKAAVGALGEDDLLAVNALLAPKSVQ